MKKRLALIIALILLLCSCGLKSTPKTDGSLMEVHFLDVGQADCTLIECGGKYMLIDGGNRADSSFVYAYLKDEGVKELDCIVATHPHEDHIGGLLGALSYASANVFYSSVFESNSELYGKLKNKLEQQGVSVTVPAPKESFELGGAKVTFLGPVEYENDENEDSLCLRIDYGKISFLFTGDAGSRAEKRLVNSYPLGLDATVLKVGHHGSGGSSCYEFLRAVSPEYAVISTENNSRYGHPHESTLSRLRDAGAAVYRTDENGTVVIKTDGTTISVTTQKGETHPYGEEKRSSEDAMYIGNISSEKYHLPTCRSLPKEENRIYFYSLEEALNAGYSPCKSCQ